MTKEELIKTQRDAVLAITELKETIAYLDAVDELTPLVSEDMTDKQLEAVRTVKTFHVNLRNKLNKRLSEFEKVYNDAIAEYNNILENERQSKTAIAEDALNTADSVLMGDY